MPAEPPVEDFYAARHEALLAALRDELCAATVLSGARTPARNEHDAHHLLNPSEVV
jgi:hypothetical protein